MSEVILNPEARQKLVAFVESRTPGTPYRRRATILLLADEGEMPVVIAPKVGLPVAQVRFLLRAFRRQGMGLFPRWILREGAPFTPEMDMAEAGRIALAQQLAIIQNHDHSLRKGAFRPYRRCLKRTMRHLARARDLHVFLVKLDRFQEGGTLAAAEREALAALRQMCQSAKDAADEEARRTASRSDYQECLASYRSFTESVGTGVPVERDPFEPRQVRHQAPVHIYRRLAAVRAFEEHVATATVPELHQLRICFKELRYTLEFFAPVLGREIEAVLADLNKIQDHLGDLNDARVALTLLAETEGQAAGVRIYQAAQEMELAQLVDTFGPVWDTFNGVAWRDRVAAALSVL